MLLNSADHPKVGDNLVLMAKSMDRQGMYDEGIEALDEALEIYKYLPWLVPASCWRKVHFSACSHRKNTNSPCIVMSTLDFLWWWWSLPHRILQCQLWK